MAKLVSWYNILLYFYLKDISIVEVHVAGEVQRSCNWYRFMESEGWLSPQNTPPRGSYPEPV